MQQLAALQGIIRDNKHKVWEFDDAAAEILNRIATCSPDSNIRQAAIMGTLAGGTRSIGLWWLSTDDEAAKGCCSRRPNPGYAYARSSAERYLGEIRSSGADAVSPSSAPLPGMVVGPWAAGPAALPSAAVASPSAAIALPSAATALSRFSAAAPPSSLAVAGAPSPLPAVGSPAAAPAVQIHFDIGGPVAALSPSRAGEAERMQLVVVHAEEMAKLRSSLEETHRAQMAAEVERHSRELSEIRAQYKGEIAHLSAAGEETRRAQVAAEAERHAKDLSELRAQHKGEIARLLAAGGGDPSSPGGC